MRTYKYLLISVLSIFFASCADLDVPPMNVVQDKDLFTDNTGITIYMARLYSGLPMEDFRYARARGINQFYILNPTSALTGEALCRDVGGAGSEGDEDKYKYWTDGFKLIRECNHFLKTLPQFAGNFTATEISHYTGEAHFIRAFTYYALAKRYGGVPIVEEVLQYPEKSAEELKIARASEEKTWDFIAADLDIAIAKMNATSQVGRANSYVAAGLKSRAMLHAGSIAKYNQGELFDDQQNRLCGMPVARANGFFKQSYDAALLLEGKFSLYKGAWKADDKEAQYKNFLAIFTDKSSSENILVKQYSYPSSVHGYDAYNVPRQLMGPTGYSSSVNPTLNFVEMFDGLPKNSDGTLKTLDANGNYILYDKTMDLFANAEPRLRASVIFPGDVFKGEEIEIWRGIYTGEVTNGIKRLIPEGYVDFYKADELKIVESTNQDQKAFTLPNGKTMTPAGKSGVFVAERTAAISGFSIRKLLNEATPTSLVMENRADQTWVEMRYAEILLNRAEAAYELYLAGQAGNYQQDAFKYINEIRERAGADLLASPADLNINVVRKERRKELGFENKIWWDLKRWRIIDKEQQSTIFRTLMPFYAAKAEKWFFDARLSEQPARYTFDTRWYYHQIPGGEMVTGGIKQNPGY